MRPTSPGWIPVRGTNRSFPSSQIGSYSHVNGCESTNVDAFKQKNYLGPQRQSEVVSTCCRYASRASISICHIWPILTPFNTPISILRRRYWLPYPVPAAVLLMVTLPPCSVVQSRASSETARPESMIAKMKVDECEIKNPTANGTVFWLFPHKKAERGNLTFCRMQHLVLRLWAVLDSEPTTFAMSTQRSNQLS